MRDKEKNNESSLTKDVPLSSDYFIDLQSITKKLIKDTLMYIPAMVIPGIMGVVGVVVFTRIFPPDIYGQFILVITTTAIITAIISQWLTQAALRYRATYVHNKQAAIFNRSYLMITWIITLIIICIFGLLFPFRSILGSYRQYYIISILIIIASMWYNNFITILQADLKSLPYSLYMVVNSIFKFIISLLPILFIYKNVQFLLWGQCLAFALLIFPILLSVYSSSNSNDAKNEPSTKIPDSAFSCFVKQFWTYGYPMIGWFIGAQLLSMADRYMLQIFRNAREVGIYGCNYNLVSSAISFVALPLLTAAHPLLMKAGMNIAGQREYIQNTIKSFSRYFILLSFPILTYFLVFSKDFANIFLGAEYRVGNILLPIILFGILVWYFAMFGHKSLELQEKTGTMFIYVIVCTIVKIILNIIFIPRYGYMAAAYTTIVCFLLYPILVYLGTRSNIKWLIPWTSILRTGIASLLSSLVLMLIKLLPCSAIIKLFFGGILLLSIFPLCLLVIGELRKNELNALLRLIKIKSKTLSG